jgi:Protein of unknown function (DUF3347)
MYKRSLRMIAAGIVLALAHVSEAAPPPKSADPLVESYLSIQRSLAADSTAGVSASAQKLATEARRRAQESAEKASLMRLTKAAEAMQGNDLKTLRDGFKELSRAMVVYLDAAPVAGLGVYYCPMAKARWVQKTGPVANPYLGKAMATCGTPVKK